MAASLRSSAITAIKQLISQPVASSSSSSRHISTSSSVLANVTTAPKPTILQWPKITPHSHTNCHTATLALHSYETQNLDLYTQFALQTAHSLQIPTSNPASLPTTKSLYTVVKGPFIHKKAQENFQRKTHRRVIKVFDSDQEIVDLWLRYLKKNSIPGVGMRAQIWERVDYGSASQPTGLSGSENSIDAGTLESSIIGKAAEKLVEQLSGAGVAELSAQPQPLESTLGQLEGQTEGQKEETKEKDQTANSTASSRH